MHACAHACMCACVYYLANSKVVLVMDLPPIPYTLKGTEQNIEQ